MGRHYASPNEIKLRKIRTRTSHVNAALTGGQGKNAEYIRAKKKQKEISNKIKCQLAVKVIEKLENNRDKALEIVISEVLRTI